MLFIGSVSPNPRHSVRLSWSHWESSASSSIILAEILGRYEDIPKEHTLAMDVQEQKT